MSTAPSPLRYHWKFFRVGGLDQVSVESGNDLLNLKYLDPKLWVALTCPVKGLELDEKTLALIDTDGDGRIRVPEVLGAIEWSALHLKSLDDLLKPGPALPLRLINDETPGGKTLLASAKQILANLGKADSATISVVDTLDTKKIFAETTLNGDGIIPVEVTGDAETRQIIADIIATLGAETDLSGKPGINQAKLDQFYTEVAGYVDWLNHGNAPEVLVYGPDTPAAYEAFKAVRTKIEDYFTRCRVTAFDVRAENALNRQESEFLQLAAKDLAITSDEIAAFPLAHIAPDRALPLRTGVNPAWASRLASFIERVVMRAVSSAPAQLTLAEWNAIVARFIAYESWLAAKPATSVEKLGPVRAQAIHTGRGKAILTSLIARDKALEPEAQAIQSVERLARYYRDLGTLVKNFVNFADFYDPRFPATFQAGILYLDSRSCELCIRVEDPGAHAVLASLSKMYIAYCDLKRTSTGEAMKIAACFTQGDSDYLMVGRNGLFYDRRGRDWDATITKIIDNPISIHQAFWMPYKKFIRMVEEQAAKRAASADAANDARLLATATAAASLDPAKPPPPPKKIDVGSVAALGVAVGALGTAAGYFLGIFKGLEWWQFPLVIAGLMLLISLPSMAIAWLKLRQRTLGPILDGNGWAVNGRVKINVPFGASLTARAVLPPGASHRLDDPFADKAAKRRKQLFILLLLLVLAGAGAYGYYAHEHQLWPFEPKPAPPPSAQPEKK